MKTQAKAFFAGPRKAFLVAGLAASAMLFLPRYSVAQTIALSNGGSAATVDLSGSDGVNSWTVDTSPAVSQLNSQWFYYSVNGGAVKAINTLSTANYSVNAGGNILNATYNNGTVSIGITYDLQGSGSGSGAGDILDSITATNVSSGTLTSLRVFEYANFDLLQSGNNSIGIGAAYNPPPPLGTGALEGYDGVSQMSGSTAITEAINSPYANFAEAGTATGVLGDVTSGPDLSGPLSVGPGDGNVAWALEWSYQNVTTGAVENVLEDQTLSIATVPEPSTIALIGLGLGAVGFLRRRRQAS